ncbi:probable polygalacturonase At3g15720 isoform X1 [Lycium ferocissimum]|uniref:probable polygalacturonase At3g15720 isoform X1 n=1 Tax=Lycium ferocissimum TaxID=112874 RepID=UPI0028151B0D|nr:probable polygalacturonase At3g15720 isoform X1 [Lycium ferocissimum]
MITLQALLNFLNFHKMKILISFFLALLLPSPIFSRPDSPVFNVLDYGAVGDGSTDSTSAFNRTWGATCTSSSSPTMYVPSGNTFLLHQLKLSGPCASPSVTIEINGNIVAPSEPSEWRCMSNRCDKWISFKHVNGLTVRGSGIISGHGHKWWDVNVSQLSSFVFVRLMKNILRLLVFYIGLKLHSRFLTAFITSIYFQDRMKPTAFEISHSKNISLSGLSFKDNPRVHVNIESSESARVSNITIDAPAKSPNTDGIHVSDSRDVSINNCRIGTGDDCISIVDGCSNLKISNIICGPGHGISIGSLGKHGSNDNVENIVVSDVVFIKSTNGARIKTWQGGQGHARNIIFERILSQDSYNPIIIDQFYCDHEQCTEHDSAVKVSDIIFRQIVGTSKGEYAVKLDCSASVPCTGILMEDVYIRSSGSKDKARSYTSNARGLVRGQNIPHTRL